MFCNEAVEELAKISWVWKAFNRQSQIWSDPGALFGFILFMMCSTSPDSSSRLIVVRDMVARSDQCLPLV